MNSPPLQEPNYLIAIATYKRPDSLARLLDSLERSCRGAHVDVIVVDNDPEESAHDVASTESRCDTYVVERVSGIASARNAALSHFSSKYEAIVFVDDDEWVEDSWFAAISSFLASNDYDVVQGPVVSELPQECPEWIQRGGFFQRERVSNGVSLLSAATNNTIMRRDCWVRAGTPIFDVAFSETGGSDWDFFWRLRKSGARIVFCDDAIVHEEVQLDRLSYRWLGRRAVRSGIVHTRVRLKCRDRPIRAIVRGQVRLAVYLLKGLMKLIATRTVHAKPFVVVHFEIGKALGLIGFRTHEYRREPDLQVVK